MVRIHSEYISFLFLKEESSIICIISLKNPAILDKWIKPSIRFSSFLKKVKYPSPKKFYNLHQRILEEVLLSCEFALFLRECLAKNVKKLGQKLNYQFRYIHADIGGSGATKDMIKEVTGLIKGNGFEPKIKPESFAASVVADRFT